MVSATLICRAKCYSMNISITKTDFRYLGASLAKQQHGLRRKLLIYAGVVIAVELIFLLILFFKGTTVAVLQPAGSIAEQQRDLILFAAGLSLVIIVPVFSLLFFILWRYRDGNVTAKYTPDWAGSRTLETIWWGGPLLIITVLAVVTWNTSHSLDPYKPLLSNKQPLTIQVVALQWKWLFIYPDHNIATVNYLQIPTDRPVEFQITADAPMNSFWVPQLGGQVYAMSGMETKLHLIANTPGSYRGSSANISGRGFAGMKFTVDAVSDDSFNQWVKSASLSKQYLNSTSYQKLAQPSEDHSTVTYAASGSDVYDLILHRYQYSHGSSHINSTTGGH